MLDLNMNVIPTCVGTVRGNVELSNSNRESNLHLKHLHYHQLYAIHWETVWESNVEWVHLKLDK